MLPIELFENTKINDCNREVIYGYIDELEVNEPAFTLQNSAIFHGGKK